MRALAIIPALCIPLFGAIGSCATQMSAETASVETSGDDCAVMAAVAKEHYRFGPDNPPPPLRNMDDTGWAPDCNWSSYGLAFTPYSDAPQSSDPRQRMEWVEFKKPAYDGQGALVATGIMHGPLAGIGYECRVRSGVAGWTVGECKTAWVS
jgi:hypothetical protein